MKKLQITLIGIFLLLGCAKEEALQPTIIDTPPSVFTEDATNVTLKSAFIVGKVQDVAYSPTIVINISSHLSFTLACCENCYGKK